MNTQPPKAKRTTQLKTAKKPCKHCGGLQRYASFGGCPCRLAAYSANRFAIRPYVAENIWLSVYSAFVGAGSSWLKNAE